MSPRQEQELDSALSKLEAAARKVWTKWRGLDKWVQIASVLLQVREFDHTVEFKNITLDPSHKTQPTVKKSQ